MITEPLIVIALCIVIYGAFSARLAASVITSLSMLVANERLGS